MTVNALNPGAKVWLADLEDSLTPSWRNVIQGQVNLIDALTDRIDFVSPRARSTGSAPPRNGPLSWSGPARGTCPKKNMLVDGKPIAGGIMDFGPQYNRSFRE